MARSHQARRSTSKSHKRRKYRKIRAGSLNPWWYIASGALLVLVLILVLGIQKPLGSGTKISAEAAHGKYLAGAFFLDVRSQEEWNEGHVPKSIVIPLDELPSRIDEIPTDADVVVICQSGIRSQEGVDVLLAAGFEQVSCLDGGINAWENAGYPLESVP